MADNTRGGPSWLGIGTQRSGTTWLTNLLLEHPRVALGQTGAKENHYFYRDLMPKYVPWRPELSSTSHQIVVNAARAAKRALTRTKATRIPPAERRENYLKQFPNDGVLRGEWTPDYLPCIWSAAIIRDLIPEDTPLLVVLRDPVERFASAMRLESTRSTLPSPILADRFVGGYGVWCGMYLHQLETWASIVGRERLLVAQYETVRKNPQDWASHVWRVLDLQPVTLRNSKQRSETSRPTGWAWPDGLKSTLVEHYRPQRNGLEQKWGIDTSLWTDR